MQLLFIALIGNVYFSGLRVNAFLSTERRNSEVPYKVYLCEIIFYHFGYES